MTAGAERLWPDSEVRRRLEASYLRHAAESITANYPTHVWPRPTEESARALDPVAVQGGFVEGVRFVCDALHSMANEAESDAAQFADEKVAS